MSAYATDLGRSLVPAILGLIGGNLHGTTMAQRAPAAAEGAAGAVVTP
jgi:hypothetical protein